MFFLVIFSFPQRKLGISSCLLFFLVGNVFFQILAKNCDFGGHCVFFWGPLDVFLDFLDFWGG